ncbi:anon-35F/36A [Verticillium dahliae]|nr:anon-35F/36A [Verticillium dahliae]
MSLKLLRVSCSRRLTPKAARSSALLWTCRFSLSGSQTASNFHSTTPRYCSSATTSLSASKMAAPFSAAAAHADYKSPSFTQKVVDVMRKHFPEELAERSWDNVGLLLGNLETGGSETKNASPVVLVTNDLTYAVAKEAIAKKASVIVAYHPIIFSGLKSITSKDAQQATLILLASHGIAVYSPHTALDAAPNGINAWLADAATGSAKGTRAAARLTANPPEGFTGAGAGLVVTFDEPQTAGHIASSLAAATGHKHLTVATPDRSATWRERPVKSVAVCAGSGWDVIKDTGADVFVTGEVSHHSALKAVQDGILLFTLFHSNSERGFLRERLVPLLQGELTALEAGAKVYMSEVDRDPFEIITV